MVLVESLNKCNIYYAGYKDTAILVDKLCEAVLKNTNSAAENMRLRRIVVAWSRHTVKSDSAYLVEHDSNTIGAFIMEDKKVPTIMFINLTTCDEYQVGEVINWIVNTEYPSEDVFFHDSTGAFSNIGEEIVSGFYKIKSKVSVMMHKLYGD